MYDVLVAGGGTAGVPAAIAAARLGAKVLLVEKADCLGGMLTHGRLGFGMDYEGKGGIALELQQELQKLGLYDVHSPGNFLLDIQGMAQLLQRLCDEAGVETRLGAQVVSAKGVGTDLKEVEIEQDGCRLWVEAGQYIDATGDGQLAYLAGCGFDSGDKQGKHQPCSVFSVLSGVPEDCGFDFSWESKMRLFALLKSLGCTVSYPAPLLKKFPRGGLWSFCVNHEYNVQVDSPEDRFRHWQNGVAETERAVEALRGLPGWENIRIEAVSSTLGVRDSRRIHGLYLLSREDLERGSSFEDGVCLVQQRVDIHSEEGYHEGGTDFHTYEIPYRSLCAKDTGNLLLAGRCISGDFIAEGSYRVTGNCVAMGEAAGIAAVWRARGESQGVGLRLHREMMRRGYRMKEDEA